MNAQEHAQVWHHAADEIAKLVKEAEKRRDWQTLRPMAAVVCLARPVAEGYDQRATDDR